MKFLSVIARQIRIIPAVYFALVMATGIISIGGHLLNLPRLSVIFFYLNQAQYYLLLVLLVIKAGTNWQGVIAEFTESSTSPSFLTFVAASSVLGVQYCLLSQSYLTAMILWFVALAAWLFIIYAFLAMMITKPPKPSLEDGLNGAWLLMVVSTQSAAILGTQLIGYLPMQPQVSLFIAVAGFFLGVFFYMLVIPLIFFRLTFDPMKAKEFTPPYWVLMGAAAITTLSGAMLIQAINKASIFTDLVPSIKSLCLLFWIVATWWIPLLILLEVWRHLFKKLPVKYDATYWDTVFTLGMYAVCSFKLSQVLELPWLKPLPDAFIYIALFAWLITFVAMIKNIAHNLSASD